MILSEGNDILSFFYFVYNYVFDYIGELDALHLKNWT